MALVPNYSMGSVVCIKGFNADCFRTDCAENGSIVAPESFFRLPWP
jgi:hypothetical protein